MLAEALLGAGLVLFGLVGDDDSIARAWVMAFHLVNTCLLLACAALTAWNAGELTEVRTPRVRWAKALLISALAGTLILVASGAVAALGDTLFPVDTFSEGLSDDFSAEAHVLVRLRVYHPMLAVIVSCLVLGAAFVCWQGGGTGAARFGILTGFLFLAQLTVGVFNLLLLAPVWLQMVHLLFADLCWIALVLLASVTLQRREPVRWVSKTNLELDRA
jgi:heme A synthase